MLVVTGHVGCPIGYPVGTWVSVYQFVITGTLVVLPDSVDRALQVAVRLISNDLGCTIVVERLANHVHAH